LCIGRWNTPTSRSTVRALIVVASVLALVVPTALAAPPAHKDKTGQKDDATTQTTGSSEQNAAQTCQAERSKLGEDAFRAKYGTNGNGANAFGKCVSGASKSEGDDEDQNENESTASKSKAEQNAAKKCKAERKLDPAAFKAKYGTNHNKANAFGKCVSKLAKAKGS